jgi:manganese transport protein
MRDTSKPQPDPKAALQPALAGAVPAGSLSERTASAGADALSGRLHGVRAALPFIGPAVIASIAYMDPGNFATNIQGGASYGYGLLWVVVLANVIAMIFQALSARLGIVTGHSLAALCRMWFPRPLVLAMWAISEIGAIATDLAELVGAGLGLSLLTGIPLLPAVLVAGLATWAMLGLQRQGFRPIELLIGGFVATIGICYLIEMIVVPTDWPAFVTGAVVPRLFGPDSVTLAVGIVGATVMPHAIYLHSSLTQGRVTAEGPAERRRLVRYSDIEVVVALSVAGLVNMAMMAMAAASLHAGHSEVTEIADAYHTLVPLLGGFATGVFMLSLLASGFSSSVVGTMAGQVILADFLGVNLPLWIRRLVTMAPALFIVWAGVGVTDALIVSQVVLSLVLPVPVVALLVLCRRPEVMGADVIGRRLAVLAWGAALVVLSLNTVLLLQTAGVTIPGLG